MTQKEINKLIPNATDRKRVSGYNDDEYMYGDDCPEFTAKTRKDALIIILINVIFIGGLITTAAWCLAKF